MKESGPHLIKMKHEKEENQQTKELQVSANQLEK